MDNLKRIIHTLILGGTVKSLLCTGKFTISLLINVIQNIIDLASDILLTTHLYRQSLSSHENYNHSKIITHKGIKELYHSSDHLV